MEISHHKPINLKQMNFNAFKLNALPKIVEYDKITKQAYQESEKYFQSQDSKKKSKQNDLLLAPNPKNAYPVFIIFQKAEIFRLNN